jgi:hypothetical protein
MIVCLCGHADTDHALGEGICECSCPAYRPYRPFGHEDDDLHDLQHQEAVDGLIAEHQLAMDVAVSGEEGAVWLLLPGLPCPHGDATCPCQDDQAACHYEGDDPLPCPRTGLVGTCHCRENVESLEALADEGDEL